MTVSAEPRDVIEAALDAEYAGTGWWGSLYRAPRRHRWYRIIPAEDLTAPQRETLDDWLMRPRQSGLVPIVPSSPGELGGLRKLGGQYEFGGRWFQVVCYDTDERRTLADVIDDPRPARRAEAAAAALRALPGWRDSVGPGLTPLPADIILDRRCRPLLLPMPGLGTPPLLRILGAAERAAHLTPEEARGVPPGKRAPDLHALGVAALRCFEALPAIEAGLLLQRAACGTVFTHQASDSRIPAWMHRTDPIRAALEQLTSLTGAGEPGPADDDPRRLAGVLESACRAMDPVLAVQSLREAGDPRQALRLAQSILVSEQSYQLLLDAADIAEQDLREPLEAWSLLDRAAELDPSRATAHVERLRIVTGICAVASRLGTGSAGRSFLARLRESAQDAFNHLPPPSRRAHAHEMTCCLIRTGQLEEANTFAHRWLHDGDTLLWWSFSLMLDYAETFIGLRRLEEAAQVLDGVRWGLDEALEQGKATRREIHPHGQRLGELDRTLLDARNEDETT